MIELLKREPDYLVAGDTWEWRREDLTGRFPASAGWSLSYAFTNKDYSFSISGGEVTADGDFFAVEVAPTTTKTRAAGVYAWQAKVTNGTKVYTIGRGSIEIRPDYALEKPSDTRAHARKVLDALEALIEGKATKDQLSYKIGDRELSRLAPGELIKWREFYLAELARLEQEEKLERGLKTGNTLRVRFS